MIASKLAFCLICSLVAPLGGFETFIELMSSHSDFVNKNAVLICLRELIPELTEEDMPVV